jgi:hypothetical protein
VSLRRALRQAFTDFYFNSWRLAPANLVWGIGLVVALFAGINTVLGMAMLVALAVPVAGLHRMAALIARDQAVAFSDFVDGMRRHALAALAVGTLAAVLALVFTTNVLVGLGNGGPLGWVISALALHGLVALAMFLVAFWPILVDPNREALGFRARLALTGLTVIGRPARLLALTTVVGLVLAVSVVLFAALMVVTVAYVSVVASRYVLPLVDELEAHLPRAVTGQAALAASGPDGAALDDHRGLIAPP